MAPPTDEGADTPENGAPEEGAPADGAPEHSPRWYRPEPEPPLQTPAGDEPSWSPPPPTAQPSWSPPPAPGGQAGWAPPGETGAPYPPPASPYGTSSWTTPYAPAPPPRSRPWRGVAIGASVVIGILVVLGIVGSLHKSSSPDKSKATKSSNAAGTPAGYSTFTDSTDRFSIAVPSAWKEVDPASPAAAQAFQQLVQNNPSLKSALGTNLADLEAKGIKLLAVNPVADPNSGPNNVNVVVRPALGVNDSNLGQLAGDLQTTYAKLGANLLGTSPIQLSGHTGLQARVQLPLTTTSGTQIVANETQDFVAANDFVYIVTLTGTGPDLATIASTLHLG